MRLVLAVASAVALSVPVGAQQVPDQREASVITDTIAERDFDPVIHVSGALAVLGLPHDLYLNGTWSHCGVDAFTLLRVEGRWRIATMAWSVEQPPACAKHPAGPPQP